MKTEIRIMYLKESKEVHLNLLTATKWNFPSEMNTRTDRLHLDCTKKAVLMMC